MTKVMYKGQEIELDDELKEGADTLDILTPWEDELDNTKEFEPINFDDTIEFEPISLENTQNLEEVIGDINEQ